MTYTLEVFYQHGHGDNPLIITNGDQIDALIDALLQEPIAENSIAAIYVRERPNLPSGFPDHELRVAVNADTRVGGLRYTGTDGTDTEQGGTWFTKGSRSPRQQVWYCYMGHDEDYPQDSEVPLDTVRLAVRQFMDSGGERPQAAAWQPDPAITSRSRSARTDEPGQPAEGPTTQNHTP